MKASLKAFLLLLLSGLIITLVSCGSPEHSNPMSGEPGDEGGQGVTQEKSLTDLLASPEKIVFDDVKKFVLEPSCVECHASSGNKFARVDVSSMAALKGENSKPVLIPFDPEGSKVYSTLVLPMNTSLHMPPRNKPQLSEDQINLVFQWIENGAKTEYVEGEEPIKVERPPSLAEELQPYFDDPATVDFPAVKKFVFDTSCNDCHSESGSKSDWQAMFYGQNMTTYKDHFTNSGIVKNLLTDKIVTEDGVQKKVRGSRIYNSIAITQSMPPAYAKDAQGNTIPSGYETVGALRVKLLRLWIINCAIEDYAAITDDTLLTKPRPSGKVRDCTEPEEEL
ncbi:MAG: hypothetical protein HRT44_04900 [Bdellovibrionales bacterium]|nr:hypothetical protein [Bdellovibrionales bacterium]NQZ18580.1 hypothetical protein [Bdellovibrionales bacterium]